MWLVALTESNFEGLRKMYEVRDGEKRYLKLKNFGYAVREKLDRQVSGTVGDERELFLERLCFLIFRNI